MPQRTRRRLFSSTRSERLAAHECAFRTDGGQPELLDQFQLGKEVFDFGEDLVSRLVAFPLVDSPGLI